MTTPKPIPFGAPPIAKPTGAIPFGAAPIGFPTQTPPDVHQSFLKKLGNLLVTPDEQGQIKNAFNSGVNQVKSSIQDMGGAKNILQLFEGSAKLGAGLVNTAFSPTAPITKPIGDAINFAADKISDNPTVQKFANSKAGQVTSRVAEDVGNLDTIAASVAGSKAAMGLKEPIVNTANAIAEKLNTPRPIPPLDEVKIMDRYNRAIRPTVVGKNTAGQVAKSNSQVISALTSIADNKPNLEFSDINGEKIIGQTPKTVDQLAQGIQQTKKGIFQKYDALAKAAGEKGVTVDAPTIAAELEPVINSKSLSIVNPSAVNWASELQKRLIDAGEIDANIAQEVITKYNEALQAFYKNPNYETASKAAVDAMVANKFREALDKGITNATGEQYQTLKNQYGALSSIEKDVTHRNIVWGRQNQVGLASNLANITSGAELVRGLLRLNPADLAASVAIKGIQKWIQHLNNPDVGVSKIFSEIEKAGPSARESKMPPIKPSK